MPPKRAPLNAIKKSEKKRRDIEKSLIHRANLKKKYFKLLKKEGEAIPEKADNTQEKKKTFTYGERAELIKKRKEEKKQSIMESIERTREIVKEKQITRIKKKKQLTKKTRKGQPLMGPRINDLLDKIKSDMST